MRISDWSSDVCSSDLVADRGRDFRREPAAAGHHLFRRSDDRLLPRPRQRHAQHHQRRDRRSHRNRHTHLHRGQLTMRKGGIIPCMAVLLLSGCMSLPTIPETSKLAVYPEKTQTQQLLGVLPPPARPVAVAVYSFEDLTGQFKPSETGKN